MEIKQGKYVTNDKDLRFASYWKAEQAGLSDEEPDVFCINGPYINTAML